MNPSSEIALGIAVAVTPVLIFGALLWLNWYWRQLETVRTTRQIALTDAIHWEIGAAAAPLVTRGWLGGWTVSVALPLDDGGTVGAIVRIAHGFFAKHFPRDVQRLRIVLEPTKDRRVARRPGPPSVPDPAEADLSRAA